MNDDDEQVTKVPPQGKRGGQWISFGDQAYRVPPLGFLAVQELAAEVKSLASIKGIPTKEQMQTVVTIVHSAIARNYPDLPREEVQDMLDMGNFQSVLGAVLQIAGYEKGGAVPGEALKVAPPSTGAPLTQH